MREMEFFGMVDDGGAFLQMRALQDTLRTLAGKYVTVKIKERKRRRSLSQNAYYWGVIVERIRIALFDAGHVMDSAEVHEMLKKDVMKLSRVIDIKGKLYVTSGTTTDKTTMEFETYMDIVREWAASELGLIIPLPNEEENYG